MIKGALKSGFEFSVDETRLDDMRFIDMLAELDDGNALVLTKLLTFILGKEQKDALYEHVKSEDGRVPIAKVTEAFTEIMQSGSSLKK